MWRHIFKWFWYFIFWIYKSGIIQYVNLGVWILSLPSMWPRFIYIITSFFLYGWIIFHTILYIFIHLSVGHFGYFQIWDIMKNTAMNNCIQFLDRHVFFSLYISYTYAYILYVYTSGIASLHGNYEKLPNCFPMWVDNFTVQPALYEGFNFSSTLQNLSFILLILTIILNVK